MKVFAGTGVLSKAQPRSDLLPSSAVVVKIQLLETCQTETLSFLLRLTSISCCMGLSMAAYYFVKAGMMKVVILSNNHVTFH